MSVMETELFPFPDYHRRKEIAMLDLDAELRALNERRLALARHLRALGFPQEHILSTVNDMTLHVAEARHAGCREDSLAGTFPAVR